MNNIHSKITIIGAGSYGTALAISLSRNGHVVVLWGHNSNHIKKLKLSRCNNFFLPNIYFPDSLLLEDRLSYALSSSRDILIVVPSNVFGDVLNKLKPYLHITSRIVWATKGLESKTGRLLQDVVREKLGKDIPLAVISGPTFAKELAIGMPTTIILASTNKQFSNDLKKLLHCNKNFCVYTTSDIIGVQLGGVVKNIIAIGVGISDGIGLGSNARISLIIRGIKEISKLGFALGANLSTFMGISGLGDLILTCTDNQSRNRRFGIMLGKGITVKKSRDNINQVIEGYNNIKEVLILAKRYNVTMPVIEQIYQILYCNHNVKKSILNLLNCN
ncbi:Glycerol-3-phosphate dehydrogenase [NAD(P)+] [Serratia symbiotica]|nr:Glycerol-3-phosphate dehydrogenase [NAD(P)+] [Serratia symbiotica]